MAVLLILDSLLTLFVKKGANHTTSSWVQWISASFCWTKIEPIANPLLHHRPPRWTAKCQWMRTPWWRWRLRPQLPNAGAVPWGRSGKKTKLKKIHGTSWNTFLANSDQLSSKCPVYNYNLFDTGECGFSDSLVEHRVLAIYAICLIGEEKQLLFRFVQMWAANSVITPHVIMWLAELLNVLFFMLSLLETCRIRQFVQKLEGWTIQDQLDPALLKKSQWPPSKFVWHDTESICSKSTVCAFACIDKKTWTHTQEWLRLWPNTLWSRISLDIGYFVWIAWFAWRVGAMSMHKIRRILELWTPTAGKPVKLPGAASLGIPFTGQATLYEHTWGHWMSSAFLGPSCPPPQSPKTALLCTSLKVQRDPFVSQHWIQSNYAGKNHLKENNLPRGLWNGCHLLWVTLESKDPSSDAVKSESNMKGLAAVFGICPRQGNQTKLLHMPHVRFSRVNTRFENQTTKLHQIDFRETKGDAYPIFSTSAVTLPIWWPLHGQSPGMYHDLGVTYVLFSVILGIFNDFYGILATTRSTSCSPPSGSQENPVSGRATSAGSSRWATIRRPAVDAAPWGCRWTPWKKTRGNQFEFLIKALKTQWNKRSTCCTTYNNRFMFLLTSLQCLDIIAITTNTMIITKKKSRKYHYQIITITSK